MASQNLMHRKKTTIKLRDDKPRRNPYSSAPTAKESSASAKQNKEPELYSLGREGSHSRIPTLNPSNSTIQDKKRQRWKMASNKAKGANMVKNCVESVFNPMLERGRSFVHIIVAGERFKTTKATVDAYPSSLLGSRDGRDYWDVEQKAYVFPNQCRISFDNILFFYQSKGLLACPPNVSMESFKGECRFFMLPQESIDRCEHGVVLDMVLALEQEDKPSGFLTKWGKKIMAPGGWYKKLLGGIDMVATVSYILILMLMTNYTNPKGQEDEHKNEQENNTLTTTNHYQENVLSYLSATCVLWFIIHYTINFLSSNEKKRYCLGLLSLIDFLVVSSFLIDFFSKHIIGDKDKNIKDTITNIRILIGVARQLCIARYSTLLYCLGVALKKSGKDLLHILYILVIVILVFSSAAFFFESDSGLHIVKEEVLWHRVRETFKEGKDKPLFGELEGIAVGNRSSNETPYITKTKNYWNFKSVIRLNASGHPTLVKLDVTEEIRAKADVDPEDIDKVKADVTFTYNSKLYTEYIGFDSSEESEEYEFQPVIRNSTLKLLIIEKYVAMDLTEWKLGVETRSRFVSIPASLWWGFITITTVGYGDLAPRTAWGKLISATLALTGIPLIAIPLPLIMNKFTQLYKAKKFEDHLEKRAAKLLKERAASKARKKKEDKEYKEAAATCLLVSGLNRFERQNFVMECDESNGTTLKTCFDNVLGMSPIETFEPNEKEKSTKLCHRITESTVDECDVMTENNLGEYQPLSQEECKK